MFLLVCDLEFVRSGVFNDRLEKQEGKTA